jgi:transcriptional regulator with XRE-family HTH domain
MVLTTRPLRRTRVPARRATNVDAQVGARMRERRTLMGVSQEQLADALGLTFQQIQKYERGTNRLSASRLFQLARLLDVPVAWFFENVDASSPMGRPRKDADGVDMPDTRTLSRRETLDLVRAYSRISDRKLRRKVFAMARALAET